MSVDRKIVLEEYVSLITDSDIIKQFYILHSVCSSNCILPASIDS